MSQVSQWGQRQVFENAKNAIINAYTTGSNPLTPSQAQAEVQNSVLTQSYLRLEQPLVNNVNTINFPILNYQTGNGVPIRATEQRLAQQDAFYVSSIAVYLSLALSATDTSLRLLTYPSPAIFTTTGAAAAMYTFYNGKLQIAVNNSIVGVGYDLINSLQVPQTQQVVAATNPIDQFDPSAVNVWEPNIAFIGTKNTQLVVNMPGNVATIQAGGTPTYIVIIARGVLAQNVTLMS